MSIKQDEKQSYYNDNYQDADLNHIINLIGDILIIEKLQIGRYIPKKYESSIINGFGINQIPIH